MDNISTPYYDSMIHYRNPDVPSPVIATDSSSTSDGSCSGGYEDVMLSSSYPKKRSGRKKFRETRHPVYRGIRQRGNGKWVCEVREPNGKNRIWLGTFPVADMAARAYDVAALALRGRSALLNFADSSWRLPVPASSATKDIQKAAAEAAEIFRPMEESVEVESSCRAEEEVFVEAQDENVLFEDDEVFFRLPELMTSLAEGLMVPPPHCFGYRYESDDVDYSADVPLWSF